jgi:oligoendopeptidase F
MYVPLTKYVLNIPYDTGVRLVLESLKCLGEEYVKKAREGLLEQRWADVDCCEENEKGNRCMNLNLLITIKNNIYIYMYL